MAQLVGKTGQSGRSSCQLVERCLASEQLVFVQKWALVLCIIVVSGLLLLLLLLLLMVLVYFLSGNATGTFNNLIHAIQLEQLSA